jgi:hypothetical protein
MTAASETRIPVADVVFRQDLYPRIRQSAETVQKYAETLDVLPTIEVNQHRELIDGWHRWTAHKKAGAETIAVTVTETRSDAELLELAIERNAKHGLQLSQADKQDMARRIYGGTPQAQQGKKKQRLADILSVDLTTVQKWLSRIDKDNKEKRDAAVFSLWLACHTEEQIAEAVGMPRDTVHSVLLKYGDFRFSTKPGELSEIKDEAERWSEIEKRNRAAAEHKSDFEPPIYNIWKQQEKTRGVEHFGNSEIRWVDNLLYLYTKPFEIVVDPFAGSGSTIDKCEERFRRYWVSDRKPAVEREHEIRLHDMTSGLPKLPRWQDVSLVYLDPPYWKQAEGEYSKDAEDLANMDLGAFHKTLADTIHSFGKKLRPGAAIALIIQPTQWAAPGRAYTDHIAEMLRTVKLPLDMRFSVPYESQQCNAQMVEWAKANRRCLVLSREIVVWRV